jgi:hypothetical protein
MFSQADKQVNSHIPGFRPAAVRTLGNNGHAVSNSARLNSSPSFRPSPKPGVQPEPTYSRPEPTYHSASLNAPKEGTNSLTRR